MVLIYTSYPDHGEAEKMARAIIEKKMAIDIDIWPINSVYISARDNQIKQKEEAVLLIKTAESKVQDIENLIQETTNQKMPCIATIDVRRVNRPYKEWIAQCIQ